MRSATLANVGLRSAWGFGSARADPRRIRSWRSSSQENARMGLLRPRPVATDSTHRVTAFEIFFDLVWVFALIRIDSFMAQPPTLTLLVRGLVLLLLLWFAYQAYSWLGNEARVDVGLVRAGMF